MDSIQLYCIEILDIEENVRRRVRVRPFPGLIRVRNLEINVSLQTNQPLITREG